MKNQTLVTIIALTVIAACIAYQEFSHHYTKRFNKQEFSVDDVFKLMDTNNDHKLSKKEIKGPLYQQFLIIDVNSDLFISKEELETELKNNKYREERE